MKWRSEGPSEGGRLGRAFSFAGKGVVRSRLSTKLMLLVIAAIATFGVIMGGSTATADPTAVNPNDSGFSATVSDLPAEEIAKIYGTGGSSVDPVTYAKLAQSSPSIFHASKYMAWYRFFGVTDLPSPDGEMSLIAQMPGLITGFFGFLILSLASAGALIVGLALTLANSVAMVEQVLHLIDYMFYTVGSKLLGLDGNPSSFLTMIILGSLIAVASSILIPRVNPKAQVNGLKTIGMTLLAVVLLGIVSVQATKNHNDPDVGGSGTAEIANAGSGVGNTIEESKQRAEAARNPDSWAVLSPGWLVSSAMELTNNLGGVFSGVIDGITHSLTKADQQSSGNSCDRYIEGMHAIYQTSGAGRNLSGKANIVSAYDRLISQLYFKNYQLAALGDSAGAENSWCRMAENQTGSPVGDQVLIARAAGIYGELVGTGGLGTFTGNTGSDPYAVSMSSINLTGGSAMYSVGQRPGVLVTADGQWKPDGDGDKKDAAEVADSIFGPNYQSGKVADKAGTFSGARTALMYFAGCIWTGKEQAGDPLKVHLNSEWENVGGGINSADFNPDDTLLDRNDRGENVCGLETAQDAINSGTFSKADKMDFTIYSQGIRPINEDGNFVANWNYTDNKDLVSVSVPFFGTYSIGEGSAALQQFQSSPPARGVYLKVAGGDSSDVLVLTASALLLVGMVVRYFGPIVAGSLLAQGVAVLILLVAILSPLLLIIPGAKPSQIFKTLAKAFAASIVVTSVIGIIFSLTFGVVSLFVELFALQVEVALIRSILVGVAAAVGMIVMVKAISYGLKMDITDPKMALAAGIAAGSPVLRSMGWDVVTPVDPSYWKKPETEEKQREITTDQDSVLGSGGTKEEGLESLVKTDKDGVQSKTKDERNLTKPGEGKLNGLRDAAIIASPLLPGAGQAAAGAIAAAATAQNGYRRVRNGVYGGIDNVRDGFNDLMEPVKANGAFQKMSDILYFTATGDHMEDTQKARQMVANLLPGGAVLDSDQAMRESGIPIDEIRDQSEAVAAKIGATAAGSQRARAEMAQSFGENLSDLANAASNAPLERDATVSMQLSDDLRGGIYDQGQDVVAEAQRSGWFDSSRSNIRNMVDHIPDHILARMDSGNLNERLGSLAGTAAGTFGLSEGMQNRISSMTASATGHAASWVRSSRSEGGRSIDEAVGSQARHAVDPIPDAPGPSQAEIDNQRLQEDYSSALRGDDRNYQG